MLDTRQIEKLVRYWQRHIVYRPYFNPDGEKYECSRADENKPVFPWELKGASEDLIYTVYLGSYALSAVLRSTYKSRDQVASQDEELAFGHKNTHCCYFKVDNEGKVIKGSFKLVPFMYSAGILSRNMSFDFEREERTIREKNETFERNLADAGYITFEFLEKFEIDILQFFRFPIGEIKPGSSNITTLYIDETKKKRREHDKTGRRKRERNTLVNTRPSSLLGYEDYYIKTLEEIEVNQDCVNLNSIFQSKTNEDKSVDYDKFSSILNPMNAPIGLWPGADKLDVLQQFAINNSVYGDDPVKLIEAPAGTDRESIIKNLAAAQIIEKANFLCMVENPDDIFERCEENGVMYYKVSSELQRTEMVIVCENETNASNIANHMITAEEGTLLTDHFDAVEPVYSKINDIYYTNTARQIFKSDDAWGIPVVYLGNQDSINDAAETITDGVGEIQSNYHTKKLLDFFVFISIKEMCEATFRQMSADQDWRDLRTAYKEKYSTINNDRDLSGVDMSNIIKSPEFLSSKLDSDLYDLEDEAETLAEKLDELTASINDMKAEKDDLEEQIDDVYDDMTGREQKLYKVLKTANTQKYNRLLKKQEQLEVRLEDAVLAYKASKRRLAMIDSEKATLEKNLEIATSEEESFRIVKNETLAMYPGTLVLDHEELRSIYDFAYGEGKGSIEIDKRIISSPPMMTPKYLEMQEELLYDALQLIKTFIRSSEKAKHNINLMLSRIREQTVKGMSHEMYESLFASFQLMVPIITLSQESMELFMPQSGSGTMGLTIIPDAACWNPEDTILALSRSKKLVLMGDKYSEKPEMLLPDFLESSLIKDSDLADGFNSWGASLYSMAEHHKCCSVSKLRVTHRCIPEAFSFINDSYANSLISLRLVRESTDYAIAKTCFMDVKGRTESKGNCFVEEQGKVVISLLNTIIAKYGSAFFNMPNRDIYICSPYQTVVDGLRRMTTTKLISVLPSVTPLIRSNAVTAEYISRFLYNFKQNNIQTLDQFDIFDSPREVILALGCDKYTYFYNQTGEDLKAFTRLFANVTGRLAIIGSKDVWGQTSLYKLIEKEFELVHVE